MLPGHRRPDPASSTSASCAATSPTSSPRAPRASRASRRSSGGWSTPSPRAAASTRSCASGRWRGPPRRRGPTTPTGVELTPLAGRGRRRLAALRARRRRRSTATLGAAHITVHAPTGEPVTTPGRAVDAGAGVAARRRPPARRRHPAPALQRARGRHVGAAHRGRRRRGARRRGPARRARRALAGQRGAPATGRARSSASTCRRARSSPSSSRGAASPALLAELAAGRRPLVHARRHRDPDDDQPPATLRLTDANDGWFPMSNGLSRLATRFWGRDDELAAARGHDRQGPARRRGGRGRARHVHARRHRLGRRGPPDAGGAQQLLPRRADRDGGQLPLRRPGDDGDEDLRPPHGVAELDLPAPQRRRPRRRPAPLRHRLPPDVRPHHESEEDRR